MEENKVNKSNKIKIIVLTFLILLVSVAGISYAYFTIQITGNDTASSMRLRTANMSLVYNDVQIVSGEYVTPGWSDTKTLTVTNNGNVTAYYTIIWRDLINEIINNELVISATCSSSSGTCDDLDEETVPTSYAETHNVAVKGNIEIAPGVTHTYTLTAEFIETGSNQNYNQNKYFNGTLNIVEGFDSTMRRNGTDSTTSLPVVKIGTEEFYDISNAINYSSLNSTFLAKINYDSSKSILLAKYNLYVGRIYNSSTFSNISLSDPKYGFQSEDAKGYVDSSTPLKIGVVPFTMYVGNPYWIGEGGLKSQYGTSYSASNVYDANYVTIPDFSVRFNDAKNKNYSVACYVEGYVNRLGIDGTGRLLTYTEADAMTATQRSNGGRYWLGSAYNTSFTYTVFNDGSLRNNDCTYSFGFGVRPVIVVNTSDIQSS